MLTSFVLAAARSYLLVKPFRLFIGVIEVRGGDIYIHRDRTGGEFTRMSRDQTVRPGPYLDGRRYGAQSRCGDRTIPPWPRWKPLVSGRAEKLSPLSLWGFVFPFVSLLDSEHCDVEKRAVTVASREILKSDLSPVQSRIDGREPDKEDDVGEYRHNVKKARVRYDYVEDAYIRALDDEEMRCTRHARDKFEAELTRAIFCMPISKHLDTRMLLARTLVCALVRGRSRRRHAHTVLGERAELIREVTVRERANLYVKACAVRRTMIACSSCFILPEV